MNNLEILNNLIEETIEEGNTQIIEITSIEQLYELTMAGAVEGGGQGVPFGNKKEIKKDNEKEKNRSRLQKEGEQRMISRKDIITEKLMREYIRKKIKESLSKKQKNLLKEEEALRSVIRKLITEGDISDVHPHRSTGINMLEDVLKKAIPTLRMDFKRLTTDVKQRNSFRSHIIKAVEDSLRPMKANDQYLSGAAAGTPSALLDEPVDASEPELDELEEADIDIDIEDEPAGEEEKKIPVEDDDKPSDEEQFGTGLEDMDETGRNMAFTSYKKVSQYILDAYDSLANPKDKEIFTEYLITNLKLYFDKFEDELKSTVEEPTSQSYQQQA